MKTDSLLPGGFEDGAKIFTALAPSGPVDRGLGATGDHCWRDGSLLGVVLVLQAAEIAERYAPDKTLTEVAHAWRPYRTWAVVHLRERRNHEIGGR